MIQEKRTGLETCCKCGCNREQTLQWYTKGLPKGQVICKNCYKKAQSDYMKGNLNINSSTGRGRSGEILVVKVLNIGKEHDCNRITCGYKVDLIHKEYGKIDVKTVKLIYEYNNWSFKFNAKKEAHTYICIGLNSEGKNVEHVWVVPNKDYIRDLTTLTVYDTHRSLFNRKHYEVDVKPYNNMWKTMKLDNCKIMTNKNNNGD